MRLLDDLTSPPKERYAVSQNNVTKLVQPGTFSDILRDGARTLPAQAVEAEVAAFTAKHADLKTEDGHQRIVRHGHLPEREIMTGIGLVAVRQPRVRDRATDGDDASRIRFTPAILPPPALKVPFMPGVAEASMSYCRSSTSKASRPVTSPKHSARCLARMRLACRLRPLRD